MGRARVLMLAVGLGLLCLFLIVAPMGCGGGGGGGGDQPQPDSEGTDNTTIEGPPPLDLETEDGDSVTKLISATEGDRLEVGDLALDIPASALVEDTIVTMTAWRDSDSPYALVAMFEPDGLQLNDPALLTVTLDPPLPPGEALNLLAVDSSDPSAFVDTGSLIEVSDDGTQAFIPIEHFSGRGNVLNCHGHSVRNIVRALLARGMTKAEILQQIRSTVGDQLAAKNQTVEDAYNKLADNFDTLSAYKARKAEWRQILAYLNTFYTLADVRPNATYRGNLMTALESMDQECLENLSLIAQSSDLPPILNFSSSFTVHGGQSDANLSSDEAPVFFDKLPHSAPIVARADGTKVVIENGTVMEKKVAVPLQVARNNHPQASAEEIPRVIAVDLNELDRFRGLRSGEGLKEELRKWGADDSLAGIYPRTPWASVRIWIPKGVSAGACGSDDVDPDLDPPDSCRDLDSDGYYSSADCGTEEDCEDDPGEGGADIYPGAVEVCSDNVDNDCDGDEDCADSSCFSDQVCRCVDGDDDRFYGTTGCGTAVDCDDDNSDVHPDATEIPGDGIDQNCDGDLDVHYRLTSGGTLTGQKNGTSFGNDVNESVTIDETDSGAHFTWATLRDDGSFTVSASQVVYHYSGSVSCAGGKTWWHGTYSGGSTGGSLNIERGECVVGPDTVSEYREWHGGSGAFSEENLTFSASFEIDSYGLCQFQYDIDIDRSE